MNDDDDDYEDDAYERLRRGRMSIGLADLLNAGLLFAKDTLTYHK
jgi:hypothetical protein